VKDPISTAKIKQGHFFSRPQTPKSSMEGRRSPTTESTDIAVEELSRSAQFIKQRPSPVHTLSEAIESFFTEEKKPNPTLASHESFFSAYEGTGSITNPEGTGYTTNPFTSSNPLGEGTSSIPGPNPQLSNTLPVIEPANTMSAPKELGLCKPTLFHGDRKQISTFIQECKVYLLVNRAVYTTDEAKIAFIFSYMNDKEAKKWKDTYLRSITDEITEDINFLTYALFIALLKKNFKAYDRERQGVYNLNTIKQGNRLVEELVTKFSLYVAEVRLTSDTNSEQVMLIEKFRLALNPSLAKQIIFGEKIPKTLEGWYEKAIQYNMNY